MGETGKQRPKLNMTGIDRLSPLTWYELSPLIDMNYLP